MTKILPLFPLLGSMIVFALCSTNTDVRGQGMLPTNSPVNQTVQNVADNNPISQPVAALYPEIVANVNGDKITREQLIQESLQTHGEEVLKRILHRALILAECKRRNISITREDVEKEIDRISKKMSMDRSQYLSFIQNESNMTAQQYAEEVIWPRLALETLAADQIQVSPEEIERKYLAKYGPSVGLMMIVCSTKEQADDIYVRVTADPDSFGDVAKKESKDVLTASNKGRMQPMFAHSLSDPELEQQLFALNIGEISSVIGPYGPEKNYLLFKCENHYPSAVPRDKIELVKERLRADAADEKLKGAAQFLYEQLGREAKVENILANPTLRQQYPNLAATVNGQPIYLAAVVELALRLYGKQDLETLISMTLIQQECKKVQVTMSKQDIDTEIWIRAAQTTLPLADGSPNIAEYLQGELARYGVSENAYRNSIVWPSVALKKLSAGLVKITEDDIIKGFDANFGPSVQCLGIILKDERRARDVWQKARTLPQKENKPIEQVFGDLAAEFSVEPGSRQMRGRINPIIKNGGFPEIEEEAFHLKPGELSSVIQVDRDTFIVLYCQEVIPAKEVTLEQVRESIKADIQKKKEVLAMDEYFTGVFKRSAINNYLTNQSSAPEIKTIPQN